MLTPHRRPRRPKARHGDEGRTSGASCVTTKPDIDFAMRNARKPNLEKSRLKGPERPPTERATIVGSLPQQPASPPLTVLDAVRAIRRRWFRIGLATAVAAALGLVYILEAPRYYAATAVLIVDPRSGQAFQQGAQIATTIDSAYVDSQVEVLRSDATAQSVIQAVNMNEKSAPDDAKPTLLQSLVTYIPPKIAALGSAEIAQLGSWLAPHIPVRLLPGDAAESNTDKALAEYRKTVQARRVRQTYIIEVTSRSRDPDFAAQVANATAEIYIQDQLEAKRKASLEAITWLTDRVKDLQEEAMAAEGAVTNFKVSGSSQDRASLKALEIRGQTYRTIYETFLGRLAAARQEPFALADTRIISKALPPRKPISPNPVLLIVVIAAIAFSLASAAAVLMSRLPRDRLAVRS